MRSALVIFAVGGVGLLAMIAGGPWGPCGPSSIVGVFGMLGVLICFPLAGIVLLSVGLRALLRRLRHPQSLA